jgi:hypothetical protein
MAGAKRGDCVTLFDSRSTDQQVISRERDTLASLFSADLTSDFRGRFGNGERRHVFFSIHRVTRRSQVYWRGQLRGLIRGG